MEGELIAPLRPADDVRQLDRKSWFHASGIAITGKTREAPERFKFTHRHRSDALSFVLHAPSFLAPHRLPDFFIHPRSGYRSSGLRLQHAQGTRHDDGRP